MSTATSSEPVIQAIYSTLEASGTQPTPQLIAQTLISTSKELLTADPQKVPMFLTAMQNVDCTGFSAEIMDLFDNIKEVQHYNAILPVLKTLDIVHLEKIIPKLFQLYAISACAIESKKVIMKITSNKKHLFFNKNILATDLLKFVANNTFFVLKNIHVVDLMIHISSFSSNVEFPKAAYACLYLVFQRKFEQIFELRSQYLYENQETGNQANSFESVFGNTAAFSSHISDSSMSTVFHKEEMLRQLFNIIVPKIASLESPSIYTAKIYTLFLNYDRFRFYRNLTPLFKINNLCDFLLTLVSVEDVSLSQDLDESLKNLVRSSAYLLQTDLQPFVDKMVQLFYRNNKKTHADILKIILRISGPEIVYSYIKQHCIEFKHFTLIFKKLNNIDLSFLLAIYKNEPRDIFYDVCPNLCNYCTDEHNNIALICDIFIQTLNSGNSKNISSVSRGIRNMIQTHMSNTTQNVLLINKITREKSKHILNTICSPLLVDSVLKLLFCTQNKCTDSVLFLRNIFTSILLGYPDLFTFYKVENLVQTYKNMPLEYEHDNSEDSGLLVYCKNTSHILEMLNLVSQTLFFDYSMIIKSFSIIRNSNQAVRKRAYVLLESVVTQRKTDQCLCEYLHVDETKAVKCCAHKLSLYTVSLIHCTSCRYRETDVFSGYVVNELIRASRDPCNKTRKSALDNLLLVARSGYSNFVQQKLSQYLQSDNLIMVNGSIICMQILFHLDSPQIEQNSEMFNAVHSLAKRSPDFHKASLELYKIAILRSDDSLIIDRYLNLMTEIAQKTSKKILKCLKPIITEIRKANIEIPKDLLKFSKIQFRQNEKVVFNYTKKGAVEISKKKLVFDSDSDDD